MGWGPAASDALWGLRDPALRGSDSMGHLLHFSPFTWDPSWGSVSQGAAGRHRTGEGRFGKGAGILFQRTSQRAVMLHSLLLLCYPKHWLSHAAPCQPAPPCAQFAVAVGAQVSPHSARSPERGWRGGIFAEPSSNHS